MSGGGDASVLPSRRARSSVISPRVVIATRWSASGGDLVGVVDRSYRDRRILRHAQRLVTTQLVVRAEAGDAAQHDAGGHRTLAVEIQQRVGEEAVVAAQTFGEVGGQLEVLVAHIRLPIHSPSQAAARPSTRLTTMLATAGRSWRSSPSRWVSSIQVEKVV